MAGGIILLLGGALVLFGTRERFSRPSKETLAKGDRLFSLLAYGGFPAMLVLFFFFHFTVHFVAPILPLFIETMCDAARGSVASTTGMLLHGAAQGIFQLVMIRILYGLAAGGILPTMNALVGRLIPPVSHGKAYGLTASMTCLGMAAGPLFGGIMASSWGYRWPFFFVGFMMIAVTLPVALSIRPRPR
jgi:DHA1 family multidrug resistance protein-like MFS transporter